MSFVIVLVSGEGKFEKIEGYYAGWAKNERGHPDGFLIGELADAQRFDTRDMALNVIGADPRLKGTKILEV